MITPIDKFIKTQGGEMFPSMAFIAGEAENNFRR